MIQTLLKISLLLIGYIFYGAGLLILVFVFRLLFDVFPEMVFAQGFGFLLTLLGFWILGKSDKKFFREKS